MKSKIALVLGATGGIGGAVAQRLTASGWHVRALHRMPGNVAEKHGYDWCAGDAMSAEDVATAAQGVSLIVHAVNPPGYRDWDKLVLPMLDNTISAAHANGARILFPGTVYNYGRDAFPVIAEDAPQHPQTRKGAVRVEMERRLQVHAEKCGGSVLIVRAGDFFGPGAANNWFGQLMPAGKRPSAVIYPGRRGVGHQWAYLPDVAETMVQLLETDRLDGFATFHMDGLWDADGTRMADTICRVLGDPAVPVRKTPWWMMRLASPFVPTLREVMEMKYLWDLPIRLSGERIKAVLGEEPRTPLEAAVRATLVDMRCL